MTARGLRAKTVKFFLDGVLKATLYGKNLTDEIYYTWGQAFDATVVWFGRTREYGVNVAYSF